MNKYFKNKPSEEPSSPQHPSMFSSCVVFVAVLELSEDHHPHAHRHDVESALLADAAFGRALLPAHVLEVGERLEDVRSEDASDRDAAHVLQNG